MKTASSRASLPTTGCSDGRELAALPISQLHPRGGGGITAINSRGDIVGNSGGQAYFVAGNSTAITLLTSPDSRPGEIIAKAINDSGMVVGYYAMAPYDSSGSGDWVSARYAFKWDSATPATATNIKNLGSLSTNGTKWSEANGINNNGVIVGYSTLTNPPFVYDAFTYQGSGPMIALQRVPGVDWHGAAGITDDGVVVGSANSQGTIWKNGVPTVFTPSFAPYYNTLFLKGHMLAGTGLDSSWRSHAWALALPSAPPAQMFFTDALTGPSSPNLATIPAGKYGYTASGLQRSQSNNDSDRPVVSTALQTYLASATGNFGADITVTIANNDIAYFGLGQGDADVAGYHGEPAHAFYFRAHNNFVNGGPGYYGIQAMVRATTGQYLALTSPGTYSPGSAVTLRITRIGDNITMSVVGGGSSTYSLSAYQAALGLTNSNTKVFFGNTSVGTTFSNLKIYPLPNDVTPPVINTPANIIAEATSSAGKVVTFTATATDVVDGPVPGTASPASGTQFVIGTTPVGLAAADKAGNTATSSFLVTVRDTTPPAISAPAAITREATGPLTTVSYSASANDTVDGSVPVNATPTSGSGFSVGTTNVKLSATDSRGNAATASFNVTITDTTAPTIATPANITTEATGVLTPASFTASATDLVDGSVVVTSSKASGSGFPVGTTTVTLSATDAHGNPATASFTVTVRDTIAPVITTLNTNAPTLWPPNHKMVAVTVSASASDAVGVASLKIYSATSSEPDNGLGDGDTAGDIEITGALTLNLRAERSGTGNGRTYTITVRATDAAGNHTDKPVTVFVPKSQGGK